AEPPLSVQITHDGHVEEVSLSAEGATIGRSPDNDIVLEDPLASRHHARLDLRGSEIYVTDLGSANGTRLDGAAVAPHEPAPLRHGAELDIAGFVLRLVGGDDEATAAGLAPTYVGGEM